MHNKKHKALYPYWMEPYIPEPMKKGGKLPKYKPGGKLDNFLSDTFDFTTKDAINLGLNSTAAFTNYQGAMIGGALGNPNLIPEIDLL